jgi:hypothetical protein
MKASLIVLCFFCYPLLGRAQVLNSGFELTIDSSVKKPQYWNLPLNKPFTVQIDQGNSMSGRSSLKIESNSNAPNTASASVTQTIDITETQLKRIYIEFYIKVKNVKGNAGLWCRVLGDDNKIIGYQTLENQGTNISGTNEWKKYGLLLTVNPNARKLTIAANLRGEGLAWFDEMTITDYRSSNEEPTADVRNYVKEVRNIVKQNSIYTNQLNWASIDRDIVQLSKGLKTLNEAQILSNYIIDQLKAIGDNHSFLQSKAFAESYAKENVVNEQPIAKMLDHSIAYILIPAFGSVNDTVMKNFAQNIQQMIKKLDIDNTVKGWVVDLRQNNGGNMHPMIAGLGPLLGNGTLGYFTSPKLRGDGSAWFYKNGTEGVGSTAVVKVKDPYTVVDTNVKIAVLVGPQTASSGEMTTICFIGKSNVKLIGAATGGYTTANRGFQLKNGAYLYLASSYSADRNKKKYAGKINPDIQVDSKAGSANDVCIKAAENWIIN